MENKLCKAVCRKCIKKYGFIPPKRGKDWKAKEDIVCCPTMFFDSRDAQYGLNWSRVDEDPPECCPYKLEHEVLNGINEQKLENM